VPERDIALQVARTALRTKLHTQLADQARCKCAATLRQRRASLPSGVASGRATSARSQLPLPRC
jgi:hypothetical protein